jgi:hypothetical protein
MKLLHLCVLVLAVASIVMLSALILAPNAFGY